MAAHRKQKASRSEHRQKRFSREWVLHNAREIAISFAAAVAIWLALGFLLSTSAPLDVVTSCSMMPALQRGDLIVLQGVPAERIIAPEINVSRVSFLQELGICVFEQGGKRVAKYCTNAILVGDKRIEANLSNDIIIYDAPERGQIIHRAFAKLRSPNEYVVITKGDNNEMVDQDPNGISPPVDERHIKGKVLFRIPYIGYVKLLAFGQFAAPAGCDRVRVA